jgi:hypothetical protein
MMEVDMADINAFGRAMVRGTAPYLEDKRAARRGQTVLDQQLQFLQKQGELQAELKKQQDLYQMKMLLDQLKGNPNQQGLATSAMTGIPAEYLGVTKPLTLAEQANIDYQNKNLDLNKEELGLRREEQGYMGDYYRGRTKAELAQAGKEDLNRIIPYLQLLKEGGGEIPVQVGVEGDYVQTGVDKNGEAIFEYVERPKYQLAQRPAEGFSDAMKWAGEKLGFKYPSQENITNQFDEDVSREISKIDMRHIDAWGQAIQRGDPGAMKKLNVIIQMARRKDPQAYAYWYALKSKNYLNGTQNGQVQ